MLRLKKKDLALEQLDRSISDIADEMAGMPSNSPEFAEIQTRFMQLVELRTKITSKNSISPEVWATIIANLAGILTILAYEQRNVISKTALGWVHKLRV